MRPQIVMIIPLGDAPGNVPGYPDHTLPGVPARPDHSLPGHQPHPDHGLPGHQPGIDNSLPPLPPGTTPPPNYPSQGGPFPTHPINLPGTPNVPPGQIWPPVTELHTKTWTLAWLPGYGWRWLTVDPPRPGHELPPGTPVRPTQPLPPTAQPKT
jgi:hypothetical protein